MKRDVPHDVPSDVPRRLLRYGTRSAQRPLHPLPLLPLELVRPPLDLLRLCELMVGLELAHEVLVTVRVGAVGPNIAKFEHRAEKVCGGRK